MSFSEAFKGAQVELGLCNGSKEKLFTLGRIARALAAEALGAVSMVPYGYRALQLYRTLPDQSSSAGSSTLNAAITKDVRYGPQPRNVMDIYVPGTAAETCQDSASSADGSLAPSNGPAGVPAGAPVALFCHGGVWATGEKWHYSPLATRLAQSGIVACVVSYTLYPQASAQDMVAELSQALTWTLNNIHQHGGDPDQVAALGHSAGAHMWAMVLLERARAARRASRQPRHTGTTLLAGAAGSNRQADYRMPAKFFGMAGVYDIAEHLQYEAGRGVRYLSTMERALGGEGQFPRQSPSVILSRAAGVSAREASPSRALMPGQAEALGARVAEERGSAGGGIAVAPSAATLPAAKGGCDGLQLHASLPAAAEDLDFSLEDARQLPPCRLYSSRVDITVPWMQSCLMEQSLQACKVPVQHRMYEQPCVSHASFVTDWQPLSADKLGMSEPTSSGLGSGTAQFARPMQTDTSSGSMQGLPAFAQHIVEDIKGQSP